MTNNAYYLFSAQVCFAPEDIDINNGFILMSGDPSRPGLEDDPPPANRASPNTASQQRQVVLDDFITLVCDTGYYLDEDLTGAELNAVYLDITCIDSGFPADPV